MQHTLVEITRQIPGSIKKCRINTVEKKQKKELYKRIGDKIAYLPTIIRYWDGNGYRNPSHAWQLRIDGDLCMNGTIGRLAKY